MVEVKKIFKDASPSPSTGPWWRPAVALFSEVSTWIVVPVILAVIGGKALDSHYGTKPMMLLTLAGIGFLISSFGIVRAVRRYMSRLESGSREGSGKYISPDVKSEPRPESVGEEK